MEDHWWRNFAGNIFTAQTRGKYTITYTSGIITSTTTVNIIPANVTFSTDVTSPDLIGIKVNPNQGLLTIEVEKNLNFIRVYNSLGQEVFYHTYNTNSTNTAIDLHFFPKGLYLAHLSNGYQLFDTKTVIE